MTLPWRNPDLMICPEIAGDVRVCVPADVSLLTPYILLEQEDWFEDEIKFFRAYLQPGMRVVDIGANYGVYTLSAARRVGPQGHVWAFEPSSRCRRFLTHSIARNGFPQVTLVPAGLGDVAMRAQLVLHDNPELGEIAEAAAERVAAETVDIDTLDGFQAAHGVAAVDFVKLDAEGYETRILAGGVKFLATNNPLLMYERVHAGRVDDAITQALERLGYASYWLVPSLQALAPASSRLVAELQPLNLFACKPELRGVLQGRGLLIDAVGRDCDAPRGSWRRFLARLPYGAQFQAVWDTFVRDHGGSDYWAAYEPALDLYALARNDANDVAQRFACLQASFQRIQEVAKSFGNFSTLQTLARIAADLGARHLAARTLDPLVQAVARGRPIDLAGPFLAPVARFERLPPDAATVHWLLSGLIEGLERQRAFSTYFNPKLTLLEALQGKGFDCVESARRRQLVRMRAGAQAGPQPEECLDVRADTHRNVAFWTGRAEFFEPAPSEAARA